MNTRADDPPLTMVARQIPTPWLIGSIATLVANGVAMWVSVQTQAQTIAAQGQATAASVQTQGQAIRDMTMELRELRAAAAAGGLKTVEHDVKLVDHERRITKLEGRRP